MPDTVCREGTKHVFQRALSQFQSQKSRLKVYMNIVYDVKNMSSIVMGNNDMVPITWQAHTYIYICIRLHCQVVIYCFKWYDV